MYGMISKVKVKWFFCICMMAAFVCFNKSSVSAEDFVIGNSVFRYSENEDGTLYIYGYDGNDETVTVPSEIYGKPVVSIRARAFNKCTAMKHLIISEGITEILDGGMVGAFQWCENLETVVLPSTLKTIGEGAFEECYKLREINLPEGLINIGIDAFFKCYELRNVILPESLTSIGDYAFGHCGSIEKLVIPDSVTQIGEGAFLLGYDDRIPIYGNPYAYIKTYCDMDHKIKFSCIDHPNVVNDPAKSPNCKDYGKTAGSHCTVCGTFVIKQKTLPPNGQHAWELIRVMEATIRFKGYKDYVCTVCDRHKQEIIPKASVPKKGKIITDIKNNFSYKVTKSGTRNGTVECMSFPSAKSSLIIPKKVRIAGIYYKVTAIAKNAFKNNKTLKKVTVGQNVTKINANALKGCSNLKTIVIKSENLAFVGKNALKGIHPRAKIKVPSGRLDNYKVLFAKKGQKSTVKIIR
ncbi:hypothetical protein IMSAGC012_01005 [Lachnospiraceae bacterium]|nr:hypothetical protein IMSAGC012_01005 [Lachnospiraceae bacterium]